ncbi:MFS transporter [Paraburkholderia phenoliruptrix]|uniref:MFS transporter n=1 Tax=Paraburkholderia phenoliruptrix TaxID=252970 RepID=UPI002869DAA9|nr:MFS transporter [Paraburkholderia phenoliruptrix]WMY10910.1 MFS transporter [Paraburkholderia phenoliruptrix]
MQRLLYIAFSSASFFLVGVGIVLPPWVAFHAGGSELVGIVLLASSAAGLLLAPVAGYIVDRHDRSRVVMAGQAFRALGFLLLAPVGFVATWLSPVLLVASGISGAFGFALLSGALSGILQVIVPGAQRMAFALRLSLFNQLGVAIGTGLAGLAIGRLGSPLTALVFAAVAVLLLPVLKAIDASPRKVRELERRSLLSASREALDYLLGNSACLSAAATVGLAFAVIQITNLLLPGFVIRSLGGDSRLFGSLEMAAAISGMVALATASVGSVAKILRRYTCVILAGAGAALVVFSFARNAAAATVLYCIAGMLWNVARAAANGYLLTVVDTSMIGRVQAFTTLLTGAFGFAIYLLPAVMPGVTEASLYVACGTAIVIFVGAVWQWGKRSQAARSI